MYIVNIAVIWHKNGYLEGFGASGLTEYVARERAISKAHAKAKLLPNDTIYSVLTRKEYDALNIEQQDTLQNDWDNQKL